MITTEQYLCPDCWMKVEGNWEFLTPVNPLRVSITGEAPLASDITKKIIPQRHNQRFVFFHGSEHRSRGSEHRSRGCLSPSPGGLLETEVAGLRGFRISRVPG